MSNNDLSSSIPTQLGKLPFSSLVLGENELCSDVPTQVQALSSSAAYWAVTSGNLLGTTCPEPFVCPYENDDWYDSEYVCGWDSSYMSSGWFDSDGNYHSNDWYGLDGRIATTQMYGAYSTTIPTEMGTPCSLRCKPTILMCTPLPTSPQVPTQGPRNRIELSRPDLALRIRSEAELTQPDQTPPHLTHQSPSCLSPLYRFDD